MVTRVATPTVRFPGIPLGPGTGGGKGGREGATFPHVAIEIFAAIAQPIVMNSAKTLFL